jgi:hypothetical protein
MQLVLVYIQLKLLLRKQRFSYHRKHNFIKGILKLVLTYIFSTRDEMNFCPGSKNSIIGKTA